MDPTRTILLVFGIFLVIGGAFLLYVEAGLDRWISMGVLGAGILFMVGFAVMSFAGSARTTEPAVREREVIHEREPPRRY